MPVALTPLARASLANSLFHASKPADVLPHCAPLASPAMHTRADKAANATIFRSIDLRSMDLATRNTHLAPPLRRSAEINVTFGVDVKSVRKGRTNKGRG